MRLIALFLLFVAVSEAQRNFHRPAEDSVTSGIRKLENLRREIVGSPFKGPDETRELPTMERQRGEFGQSIRRRDNLAGKPREVRQPRRQVDSAMYEALSRLANVQIADPIAGDSPRSISSQDRRRLTSASKTRDSVDPEAATDFGTPRTSKNEATTQTTTVSSKMKFAPRKFHCYPIREIYIPKVEKKMPAYACSLGRRAFVISSERFVQDSRDHFEVNVDEGTYRRLTPVASGTTALTSGVSVLPATLVLRRGEDGYTVRGVDANWKEVHAAGDN